MRIRTNDGGAHPVTPDNTYAVVYVRPEILMQALVLVAGESKWSEMNHIEHWCEATCDIPQGGPTYVFQQEFIPPFAQAGIRVWLALAPSEDEKDAWKQRPLSDKEIDHFTHQVGENGYSEAIWSELDQMGYFDNDTP